jgi:hypothetical protein
MFAGGSRASACSCRVYTAVYSACRTFITHCAARITRIVDRIAVGVGAVLAWAPSGSCNCGLQLWGVAGQVVNEWKHTIARFGGRGR